MASVEEHDLQPFHSIVGAKAVASLVLGLGSFALAVLPSKLTWKWCPEDGRHLRLRDRYGGHEDNRHIHHDHRHRHRHDRQRHSQHRHVGDSAAADSNAASMLVLFGGGVLLFTSVMHLLVEVREAAQVLRQAGRLPGAGIENLVDLVYCAGFFATYAADELAHAVLAWCHRRRERPAARGLRVNGRTSSDYELTDVPLNGCDGRGNDAEHGLARDEESDDGCGGGGGSSVHGLFTVLALSFHEVFEGLALGLERRRDNMWELFAAVASHKFVIAFCVGLDLVSSNTRRAAFFAYVATFAAVTPAGVACGVLIDRFDKRATADGLQGPAAVFLQAFAAGTLLYVVFFEIVPKRKRSGWPHLLAFASGFVAMQLLQFITFHHGHNFNHVHQHF